MIEVNTELITGSKIGSGKLIGVDNDYFNIMNLKVERGNYFSSEQLEKGFAVCIIGKTVEKKLFEGQNPIGKHVKVKDKWMQVIRSEEHTSELQSLMRISYAVFCLKKKKTRKQ